MIHAQINFKHLNNCTFSYAVMLPYWLQWSDSTSAWLGRFSLYFAPFIPFYFYCKISSHLLDQQQHSSFDPKSHPSKFITAHLKWKMNTWSVLSADTSEIKANLSEYMNTEWMVAMRILGKLPMATSFTIQRDAWLLHACAVLCVFTVYLPAC